MKSDRLLTGMIALELGLVLPDQLEECIRTQGGQLDPRPLGEILRERGFLTERQVQRLLDEQRRRMEDFSESRLFGQIALVRGYVTKQQLGECIREQLRVPGDDRPRLGEILLRKGYLTPGQFSSVVAAQGRVLFECPSCRTRLVRSIDTPLADAVCDSCGRLLRPLDEIGSSDELPATQGETTRVFKAPLATLGKFRILGEIARGSMGIVFKAYDASLDRTVALKVLKEGDADEGYIRRLHREGAIAAKLRHPNIVTVHEVGQLRGLHYLCMDYIPGTDLLQYVHSRKLDRRSALSLLEKICHAVHHAHMQGVIHRDLKPSNILVRHDGVPVITDFGLAKSLDAALDMTKEGTAIGTPHYMPPEQVLGHVGKIDPRSDVYSLGAILYELLTGSLPFQGRTTMEMYQRILSEEPPRPPLQDPDLESIVLKALEKDRDLRYFSAEDLALDLRRWLAGESVMATRAPRPRRRFRWLHRHRKVLLAVTTTAILAAVATVVALEGARAARVRRMETEALLLRGRGEWDEARRRYEGILALDPSNESAQRGWLECSGELAAAHERWKREADRRRQDAAAENFERRMSAARPHYEAGFRRYYDALTLLHRSGGDLDAVRKRFHEAAEEFTRAIDRAGEFADASYHRALCFASLGEDRRAERDLAEAIRIDSGHRFARHERGKARLFRAYAHDTAGFLGLLGRKAGAMNPTARRLRAQAVEDFRCGLDAGYLRLAEGRLEEAAIAFTAALAENPVREDAHLGRGLAHLLAGESLLAGRHFSEAARLRPDLALFRLLRGVALLAGQETESAGREFEEAARLQPHSLTWHHAALHRALGSRFREALEALDRGLELDPEALPLRETRAGILLQLGRHDEALQECRAILGREPASAAAHRTTAHCASLRNDFETALSHYRKALEEEPDDDHVLANFATVLQRTGQYEASWEAAERAARLNPKNAQARLVRALLHADRGRVPEAESEFRAAIEIQPGHARARFEFGRFLMAHGRSDEAIAEFQAFVRLEPTGRVVAERLIEDLRRRK